MVAAPSWAAAIASAGREQGGRGGLRAVVYAAAPLQVLASAAPGNGAAAGAR